MPYNCNINWAVDRNLTTIEDLGTNSIISVVEELLMEERGEKVVERRTQTCAIYLPHKLGNLFQKTRLL